MRTRRRRKNPLSTIWCNPYSISTGFDTLTSLPSIETFAVTGLSDVEKGHGYLRLQNEDYFVNGWIDVGDSVIRKITDC